LDGVVGAWVTPGAGVAGLDRLNGHLSDRGQGIAELGP
jgi:hypothetical protein